MRCVLVLALLAALPGCRRSEPRPEPAPVAAPAAPPAPEPVPPPAAEAAASETPASGTPAAEAPAEQESAAEAPPAAEPPPAASEPPAAPAAAADDVPEDDNIYAWTDDQGTIHYGTRDQIPDDRRPRSRTVNGGLTILGSVPLEVPPPAAEPGAPAAAGPTTPDAAPEQGPTPQLDADGLPIPGSMEETAHTRTLRQAGAAVDPASVERRRAEETRRLNCRQENGATICDGE